jgi:hypothetical protein
VFDAGAGTVQQHARSSTGTGPAAVHAVQPQFSVEDPYRHSRTAVWKEQPRVTRARAMCGLDSGHDEYQEFQGVKKRPSFVHKTVTSTGTVNYLIRTCVVAQAAKHAGHIFRIFSSSALAKF